MARKVIGARAAKYIRTRFRQVLPSIVEYRATLQGMRALEIGGPSAVFGPEGPIPVYDVLASLDNCIYSAYTIWTGGVQEGATFHYHHKKAPGKQLICEATRLTAASSSYDCILASHCLEHVANPLLALSEWKRVLRVDGVLLLVLPHKDGTFDWRRPTTSLGHIIADYENQVGEDDLTHLPEILALHDLELDKPAGTKEQFRERCLTNYHNRAVHHHVFNTLVAMQVVDRAGFTILHADPLRPFHIVILAARSSQVPDNGCFLERSAKGLRRSPFPSDRMAGNRS